MAAVVIAPSIPVPAQNMHLLPGPTITLIEAARQCNGYYMRAVAASLTETNAIFNELPFERALSDFPSEQL